MADYKLNYTGSEVNEAIKTVNDSTKGNEALKTTLDKKANSSDLTSHTSNTSNPHNVTKSQVGLGNVDNTSDLNKPISTATQTALDTETTERKAQDTALQTNIDKKANTTDLDTLKSSVDSNWSTLMANLGIGRWRGQTLFNEVNVNTGTFTLYDALFNDYTTKQYCFANTDYRNIRSNIQLTRGATIKTAFIINATKNFGKNDLCSGLFADCTCPAKLEIQLSGDCQTTSGWDSYLFVNSRFTEISFTGGTFGCHDPYVLFNNNPNLTKVSGITFETDYVGSYHSDGWASCFENCSALTEIDFVGSIRCALNFEACPLSHDCALRIINALEALENPTDNHTVHFKSVSALTEDEIKIATDKGWKITIH